MQGDDIGEILGDLRSLTRWEIFLPLFLMFMSFAQVTTFAFGPDVPWDARIRRPVNVISSFTMFHVRFILKIDRQLIFWPKIALVMYMIISFLINSLLDVPQRLRKLSLTHVSTQKGPQTLKYRVINLMANSVLLGKKLTVTVFMVPLTQAASEVYYCRPQHESANAKLYLVVAPDVTCYEGWHRVLAWLLPPLLAIFMLVAMPYVVVAGDVRHVQRKEL